MKTGLGIMRAGVFMYICTVLHAYICINACIYVKNSVQNIHGMGYFMHLSECLHKLVTVSGNFLKCIRILLRAPNSYGSGQSNRSKDFKKKTNTANDSTFFQEVGIKESQVL